MSYVYILRNTLRIYHSACTNRTKNLTEWSDDLFSPGKQQMEYKLSHNFMFLDTQHNTELSDNILYTHILISLVLR